MNPLQIIRTRARESFHARLLQEAEQHPLLADLSVVRFALRTLGSPDGMLASAVYSLIQDLDKIMYGETEAFGRYILEVHNCLEAAEAIRQANAKANQGRGSRTADAICLELERLDLRGAHAVFDTDGDKVRQYPKLEKVIINSVVGCRRHHISYCYTCLRDIR